MSVVEDVVIETVKMTEVEISRPLGILYITLIIRGFRNLVSVKV